MITTLQTLERLADVVTRNHLGPLASFNTAIQITQQH